MSFINYNMYYFISVISIRPAGGCVLCPGRRAWGETWCSIHRPRSACNLQPAPRPVSIASLLQRARRRVPSVPRVPSASYLQQDLRYLKHLMPMRSTFFIGSVLIKAINIFMPDKVSHLIHYKFVVWVGLIRLTFRFAVRFQIKLIWMNFNKNVPPYPSDKNKSKSSKHTK